MDQSDILDEDGRSKLFIDSFHREHDDLFVAGLSSPRKAASGSCRLPGEAIASFIVPGAWTWPAAWFRTLK